MISACRRSASPGVLVPTPPTEAQRSLQTFPNVKGQISHSLTLVSRGTAQTPAIVDPSGHESPLPHFKVSEDGLSFVLGVYFFITADCGEDLCFSLKAGLTRFRTIR